MDVNTKYEVREDGEYVWFDPDSLPHMLQESAGGWHRLNKKTDDGKK